MLVVDGRDQTDLRAVDQDLDLLALGLIRGALGGQEREVVRVGVQVDGLAHAAVVRDEADLGPLRGIGVAGGEAAVIGADPGRSGELPGRAAGRNLVAVGGQDRRLETAVDDLVVRRRERHLVDQGGAVAALRVHADELDGVRSGRDREIRRLVKTITWCRRA